MAQRSTGFDQVGLATDLNPRCDLRLFAVRSQQGCATVFLVVVAFRVDQNRNAFFPSNFNNPAQHLFTQDPLEIIRQKDNLKLVNSIADKIHQHPALVIVHRSAAFAVNAQHLLIAGQDACFAARGASWHGDNACIVDIFLGQHLSQNLAIGIVADNTRHGNPAPKNHEIVDDVASPAQA